MEGLRSTAGVVQVCLTARAAHFPDCAGDPAARRLTVPAAEAAHLSFAGLPAGNYALAVIHDENGNGRLDMRAMVPVEGIGFSNNPRLIFGPPRFGRAVFAVHGGAMTAHVRIKYFL